MMTKPYLSYLNKLVDQCKNTYDHSIDKKPINADYSSLAEKKLRRILKLLNLKLMIESEILIVRIFLVTFALKIGQDKYLLSILFSKLILGLMN